VGQTSTVAPVAASPALWLMLAGLAVMAAPTLWHLAGSVWLSDEQGHGPVILAVSLWLISQRRQQFAALPWRPARLWGGSLIVLAAASYLLGRSQATLQLEVLAPILGGVGVLLLHRGWAALRLVALPLVCLLFVVPLPGTVVQSITIPLKIGVSWVAEAVLHAANYPIARSGVILAIDRYQLLVADACAGLTSMFTLEAMGLLYLNMRNHASRLHNVVLAVLLVPIAFVANVIRVIVLVLVTYHFGDEVGRGFVHGAAGVLLFVVAMLLMLALDAVLCRVLVRGAAQRAVA
jgi:exosortase B